MKKNFLSITVIILFSLLTTTACTNADKAPAELAVKSAEQAFNAAKAEITKNAPEEVKALESSLASTKEKLTKGEYKAALAEAHALINKIKDAVAMAKTKAEAAKAKLAELANKWTEFSENLPKMMDAIQTKVDKISKVKKLPANLSAAKLTEAKAGLASAKEDWAKAQESFKTGKLEEAVSLATSIKEKAASAMTILDITSNEGTKSQDKK